MSMQQESMGHCLEIAVSLQLLEASIKASTYRLENNWDRPIDELSASFNFNG
jgi:hypothetical protein